MSNHGLLPRITFRFEITSDLEAYALVCDALSDNTLELSALRTLGGGDVPLRVAALTAAMWVEAPHLFREIPRDAAPAPS